MESLDVKIRMDEGALDDIFREVNQCHLPGVTVGISLDGRPVYRKGFGLASIELPIVLSPAIRMRIHSVTKHFLCLAYLLLCEQGKAAVADPIGKYLPELHPVCRGISIHQLMTHTGGLQDVQDIRWQLGSMGQILSSAELLRCYQRISKVIFEPGTAWSYNNGGYTLLGLAIERIADRPLEEVFRERVFEPVGMYDTQFWRDDTDFVANAATMHMSTDDGGYDRTYLPGKAEGSGGILSTVNDMLRWLAHMDRPVVGNRNSWEIMKTPAKLANGASTGYGCGLVLGQYRGVDVIQHSGGGLGANSQILKIPSLGFDVVVMSNRFDVAAGRLVSRIVDACVTGLEERRAATGRSRRVQGTFRSARSGLILRLYEEGGEQMASFNGAKGLRYDEDRGVLRMFPTWGQAVPDIWPIGDPVHPSEIRLNDHGRGDELQPVSPTGTGDSTAIIGAYRCEIGIRLVITAEGACARLDSSGPFGSTSHRVEYLGGNLWRFTPWRSTLVWGGLLRVDGNHLTVMTLRTWGLEFSREG